MTVTQTVNIPADRRVFLDLPPELPVGKAKVTVTSEEQTYEVNTAGFSPNEAVQNLRGLAKKMGSTLTVERFIEMKREDRDLEEAEYYRLFEKKN